jgi:drug/metabolite transporter (DMT)-like permease
MERRVFKSDILLILTAVIWGFAFVAQRMGMEFVGPFTFNGIRFALGSLSLIPLIIFMNRKGQEKSADAAKANLKTFLLGGALAGIALYMGASFQQIGLVYTTAGKAGFITGLYVVIVPLMGLFWKLRPSTGTWIGAILAAIGLYLLSVTEEFTIAFGDLLELIGAFFWAGHVLILGWLSPKTDALKLAALQFATCSVLSLGTAAFTETITADGIFQAAIPILYGGMFSVGVAYTLQVVAQKHAPPSHAAIILSMESVFAAIGGWIFLNETLSFRSLIGCMFMLAGMLLSQLQAYLFEKKHKELKTLIC